jgi:hypothetical protein
LPRQATLLLNRTKHRCHAHREKCEDDWRVAAAVVLILLAEAINLTRANTRPLWLLGDPASYQTSALRQKQSIRICILTSRRDVGA